nr:FUSC family protein [Solimonas terrae]
MFTLKTLFAGFLALWLSMRFGLDKPATAMATVFIVAQPQSGFVLAKSAYRAAGTLVGSAATLLLVLWFSQSRELFIGAVALWVGLCAMGAARFRDFKAYAFVLSGYTACLIGFPAALQTGAAFDVALSRVSEVLLGIACAGIVSDVIAPQRLAPLLVALVRSRYRDFALLVADTLRGDDPDTRNAKTHAQLAADILQLESLRGAVFFEDAEARVRNSRLQQLNVDFMAALTTFHALERLLVRLRRTDGEPVRIALMQLAAPLAAALTDPPTMAAEAARKIAPLHEAAQAIERSTTPRFGEPGLRLEYVSGLELLRQLAAELIAYTRVYASLATLQIQDQDAKLISGARFTPHADLPTAFVTGLRAALALVIVCTFWVASNWPDGAVAALTATVVCCLFAAAPTPRFAIGQMIVGVALSVVLGFVCALLVLPKVDGFALLVLAMTPFLVFGLWIASQAASAGVGAGFLIFFTTLVSPQNPPTHDPAFLLNQGLALIIGMAVGSVTFGVLLPAEGDARLERLQQALRRQIKHACRASPGGLRQRFQSQCRDLLLQIQTTVGATPARLHAAQNSGLSALDIGHALIEARSTIADSSQLQAWRLALLPLLDAVAELCDMPGSATRAAVQGQLAALIARFDGACTAESPSRPALLRVIAALHRVRSGLLDLEHNAVSEQRPAGAADAT